MKTIILLLYMILGILTLFQGSKLASTIIEKKISSISPDISIKKDIKKNQQTEVVTTRSPINTSITTSPLFASSGQIPVSSIGSNEPQLVDSPLLKKYWLTGVIYLGKKNSRALIRKTGENASKIYRMGDLLDNAKIVKIAKDRVMLDDGQRIVTLPMYYRYSQQSTSRTPVTHAMLSNRRSTFTGKKEVTKVLSRSDVENKLFKRANQILTQIAISPYMKNGQMEGLRLIRVPRNNIVYDLGGRSGDIIKRVNGHPLNQIDQMYKLWENIKDDSYISVDLERNHQIYTYNFEMRE